MSGSKDYDCVIASGSLKGKILQMEVVEDFGASRSCRRCCLVTVKECCQEGVPKEKGREEGAVRSVCMHQEKVRGHKYQDQLSNVLYESGLLVNRK